MDVRFEDALLVVGLVLALAGLLSGWLHGTVLSITVLAVTAGIALAVFDVVTVEPGGDTILRVVELALILTLFSDGLVVERELLRKQWHPPARALVFAMPVTLVLIALAAKVLFGGLSWPEAFPSIWRMLALAVLTLLVARPAAVLLALHGVSLPRDQKLFVAWFGPKGIASVLFALFVLNSAASDRTIVFEIVSFTVLVSILAHGLTDTVAARWISTDEPEPEEDEWEQDEVSGREP